MISKLRAAKLASEGGVHVAIVNGRHPQAITLGVQGKIGTYFPPPRSEKKKGKRQSWPL
jgi:glutamate 5-kinase